MAGKNTGAGNIDFDSLNNVLLELNSPIAQVLASLNFDLEISREACFDMHGKALFLLFKGREYLKSEDPVNFEKLKEYLLDFELDEGASSSLVKDLVLHTIYLRDVLYRGCRLKKDV
ncbi:hypothetical protein FTO70_07585 [Methanosarcina sp. KYL-1]|uniref:hypothetical protein n=1 Tax=Methanosarcina sp. KYL-1 TaxID=2602068 RepID=UPI0021010F16|nr:hypothetical protein [Methanosarcina sp. KYL-1]MCQ1535546.1 hypothetical protein [Methanosarcina sp. KYL-1]